MNKFSQAPSPDPTNNNWLSWELILSMNTLDNKKIHHESICFHDKQNNYGTRSSALIAIPYYYNLNNIKNRVVFKATENSPNKSPYKNVELD